MIAPGLLLKRAAPFAIAIGIWFAPIPAGLTAHAWHLFAVFTAAIASVLIGSFPLLTAAMVAVGTVVLTGTITPAQAFSGFANSSVLLVVIAFIVAQAVVKSGLGRRISLFMVSRFGGSSLGLAYSLVLTDAAIAPAFPSNTARGGVLFPIVLSVAKGAGSNPDDPEGRRLGALTYHDSCHLKRTLHAEQAPRALLRMAGAQVTEMPESDTCCGMGGSYSVKLPEISAPMLQRKLDHIGKAGLPLVAMDCPGCVMQIRGGLDQRESKVAVRHTAELLAEALE